MHRFSVVLVAALAWFGRTAFADDAVSARTGELPLDAPYVPVSLDAVANDPLAVTLTADRVQVQGVPFNLVKKPGVTHLFLKPIGWNAAKNEDAEYPSYIANYDNRATQTNNPMRAIVQVPVADYAAVWLLATCDNDTNLSNIVTFRLGVMEGQARVVYHDFSATVPRAGDTTPAGVVKTIPGAAGNLYLVRVPMGKIIAQDFPERSFLDLDITKELRVAINLPDPYRFQLRPLGPSSGVRIYGLTLERAPVSMVVTGSEPGNVFNEPQTPAFNLELRNVRGEHWIPYTIQAVAVSDTGVVTTNVHPKEYRSAAWVYSLPTQRRTITVPVKERGLYRLRINLVRNGEVVVYRETTFALLAPDTRKHRDESPFGTWDFFGSHITPNDMDLLGPLYVKLGMRYGPGSASEADRKKYGVLDGSDPRMRGTNDLVWMRDAMANEPGKPPPARFLTFHESSLSGPHLTRTPDMFTGRPPYKMSPEEQKAFKDLWVEAENSYRAGKGAFPKAEGYFGNTVPHVVEEFLRAKFPRNLIDKVGNESGNYMRMPETQPLDFVPNNAGLWMFRQILDHYGYGDVELRQCLEMCYPNNNPGNLSERTQAAYIVRHMMHSLAWKIPVIRPMTITDVGNSYHYSNWGATGLCNAWPNVSPKLAFVSFATMTQVLDGAKFVRAVPTGSTVVYALEFQKKDKIYVTVFWTPRGSRAMTVQASGARKQKLTNLMGRETEAEFKDGKAEVVISREPCYLATPKPISALTLGAATHEARPGTNSFVVSSLDKLSDWSIESGHSVELATYNFMNPRRKGNFEYREVPSSEGGTNMLEVKPKLPVEGSVYLQMYSVIALNKPVEIPGQPTEIGLMVNGNGGWGRVIFELEDAGGQRWVSIGAEQQGAPNPWMADWLKPEEFAKLNPKSMNVSDWNSDDAWGRSFINHDGWRFVRFPLPGQYPGEGYHWPKNSQWRFSGDGVVKYPLKFKKLILTMPEKVLYVTQYIPPPRYEIQLRDLMVTYDPVEKVFDGE